MGGSLSSRAAVRGSGRAEQAPEASALSRVPVSVIALIAAVGVFVSSMGYAAGRAGVVPDTASGVKLYWAGQALILIPVAGRLLSRRHLSNGDVIGLIVVLTVAEYLLKVNYSPLGFAFGDEFFHWRGTTNMLQSGKLFEVNYGLPIGTYYPGLEEVASALVSATGLSVFEAGLIVAGIAHLLFICFLYVAFCASIRSYRIAGIAVLIYFAAPSLTSFDSMFVYETLGLAFLGFCVVAGLQVGHREVAARAQALVHHRGPLHLRDRHHAPHHQLHAHRVPYPRGDREQAHRLTQYRGQVRHPRDDLRDLGHLLDRVYRARNHPVLQPDGGRHDPGT